jgi:hydroxyacyl-ACP dehydratase HTD2-like protein with hotdog domain
MREEPQQLQKVTIGQRVLSLQIAASAADVFRFSAVTWNAHRIHLDESWARGEGLPGAVVQAHLHGAWFARVARTAAGSRARLCALSWTNRRPVVIGERVDIEATVSGVEVADLGVLVHLAIIERNAADTVTVDGAATVLVAGEPS